MLIPPSWSLCLDFVNVSIWILVILNFLWPDLAWDEMSPRAITGKVEECKLQRRGRLASLHQQTVCKDSGTTGVTTQESLFFLNECRLGRASPQNHFVSNLSS
jgi:hypothetical protein